MRFIGLLLISFSLQGLASQNESLPLASTYIQPFHVEGLGVHSLLRQAASKAGIPIGLEMDTVFGKEVRTGWNFPGGSMEDLARMCASLLDHATWSISSNKSIVISTPGYASSLGDLSLSYPGQQEATRQKVWDSFQDVSVINTWLDTHRCKRAEVFGGHEWHRTDKPFMVPPEIVSLNKLLEEVTVKAGGTSWGIIKNSREGECEINIVLW